MADKVILLVALVDHSGEAGKRVVKGQTFTASPERAAHVIGKGYAKTAPVPKKAKD